MKIFLTGLIFFFHISMVFAVAQDLKKQWLATPVKFVDERTVAHIVKIDDRPYIRVDREEISYQGINYVKILDISEINNAQLSIWAEDNQGRWSDADPETEGYQPVPFELLAKPSVPSRLRIIQD